MKHNESLNDDWSNDEKWRESAADFSTDDGDFDVESLKMGNNPSMNNPIMKNAFEMAQKGDSKGVEELARNLCREKGINPDEAITKVKQQLGM